jgi:D-alanyl-D-alanine carboxypeptidase
VAVQLQGALENQRALRGVPGIAAAVIFPDGSRWAGAAGSAALDPLRAATPDTPYVVGSITKTFVAALTLQLAEEGILDLDETLDSWLPDYPRAGRITLRHLLNHTSGVFNYFEHPAYNPTVFGQPSRNWQPQEILDAFSGPPYFEPGTGWHYSNTGFVLLGMVIEAATGLTLGEQLDTRFITPLGLADSYFQDEAPPVADAAQGHLRRQGVLQEVSDRSDYRPTKSAATVAWAAGGMVLSADDLATWCRALYGGDLLSPDSTAQLTDYALPGALNYGLGTRTRLLDGRRMFGHTGSLRGFMAVAWHFPDVDLTVVLLNNLGRINPNPMVDSLSVIAMPLAAGYVPDPLSPSPTRGPFLTPPPSLGVSPVP